MANLHLTLTPRTPIWTGGIQRQSDRLHETGILGSLRWWYEAIVRGLGGKACDPTSHQCAFDDDKFQRPTVDTPAAWRSALGAAGLCDVCQAYGATGWGRRFSLRAGGGRALSFEGALNVRPKDRNGGWFLGAGIVDVQNVPHVQALVLPNPLFAEASLLAPLALASRHGAVGARSQHGYGVVDVAVRRDGQDIELAHLDVAGLPGGSATADGGLPSLRNMFFATITLQTPAGQWWDTVADLQPPPNLNRQREREWVTQLTTWTDSGSVPISPVVRNYLRFRKGLGITSEDLQNYVFGSSESVCRCCYQHVTKVGHQYHCPQCGLRKESEIAERVKTKLNISAAYPAGDRRWQVRLWGWLPAAPTDCLTIPRDVILQALYDIVTDNAVWSHLFGAGASLVSVDWREFASGRDATTGAAEDGRAYLKSLVQAEGA